MFAHVACNSCSTLWCLSPCLCPWTAGRDLDRDLTDQWSWQTLLGEKTGDSESLRLGHLHSLHCAPRRTGFALLHSLTQPHDECWTMARETGNRSSRGVSISCVLVCMVHPVLPSPFSPLRHRPAVGTALFGSDRRLLCAPSQNAKALWLVARFVE